VSKNIFNRTVSGFLKEVNANNLAADEKYKGKVPVWTFLLGHAWNLHRQMGITSLDAK
jgi:hypothetical protein